MYKSSLMYRPYIRLLHFIIDSKKYVATSTDTVSRFASGHQQTTTGAGVRLIVNAGLWRGRLCVDRATERLRCRTG
jgi:hypothetical protein